MPYYQSKIFQVSSTQITQTTGFVPSPEQLQRFSEEELATSELTHIIHRKGSMSDLSFQFGKFTSPSEDVYASEYSRYPFPLDASILYFKMHSVKRNEFHLYSVVVRGLQDHLQVMPIDENKTFYKEETLSLYEKDKLVSALVNVGKENRPI